ncbi:MAG: hypothetical protein ACR2N3_05565 [Pyrinomonadaceae bacterium]
MAALFNKNSAGLTGLAFFGWLTGVKPHTTQNFVVTVAAGVGFGLVLGLVSWLIGYVQASQVHKQNLGDVYIAKQGVLKGDVYHHWNGSNQRLSSVSYEAGNPTVLQFNYFIGTSPILSSISTATLIADYSTGGEVGHVTNLAAQTVRLPVPPGKEQEARELAAMFSRLT